MSQPKSWFHENQFRYLLRYFKPLLGNFLNWRHADAGCLTCDGQVNVAVVSLPLTSSNAQEPTGVQLGERADQQGTVGLLVVPYRKWRGRERSKTLTEIKMYIKRSSVCFCWPASRQRDAISSPLDDDGGGRRRADPAGQHDRLSDQSLHLRRVALIDGHSSQGQTEGTGRGRQGQKGGKGRKRGKDDQEKSWKIKDREGRRRVKESLYALLLVLWLVVTKAKHKDCPQPGVRESSDRRDGGENPAVAHKRPMQHDRKWRYSEPFTHKTTNDAVNQRWC